MQIGKEQVEGLKEHHLMNKDELSAIAVTMEELNELSQVLAKFIRYRSVYQTGDSFAKNAWLQTLVVEISDVLVMLSYLTEHFEILDETLNKRIAEVILRYRMQGGDKYGRRDI